MLKADVFDTLRDREFSRLDEQGLAYLDYAAAGLYGSSQAAAYARSLGRGVYGNPHSEHTPSRLSEAALTAARRATLDYFDADPDVYDVCFAANTSAAIKLVAESYPFGRSRGLVMTADNHNSVNGVREYVRRAGAPLSLLPLGKDLRLEAPGEALREAAGRMDRGLLAFPAQSNFSGVRHSLDLVGRAQDLGLEVLVDAAGLGVCGSYSLRRHPADFLAFSFYKLFGLPTGVGALIAKREALAQLRRPWFAGGTVDFVSILHDRHQLSLGHAGFEDGTPDFLAAEAITTGFEFLRPLDIAGLQVRLGRLVRGFIDRAAAMRHRDGAPMVRIYGPTQMGERGGTVAFNVLRPDGRVIPYQTVEAVAREAGVALRGGCFCNPGAAERAFGFERHDLAASLDALGPRFTIPRLQERLSPDAAVGALRLSVGLPTNAADIDRALRLVARVGEMAKMLGSC